MGKRIIVEDNASPSAKIVKKTNNQKSNKLIEAKKVETGTSSVSVSLLLFQTPRRFDYAVLRARSPRQVITPG